MSWFKKIAQRFYDPDMAGFEDEDVIEEDLPEVTPENVYDYEPGEDEVTQAPPDIEESFLEEIPERYFAEDESSLVEEAVENRQCLYFEYTTRNDRYAGVRIVEPYGTFTALGTGNLLMVTWDRTAGGIRAFIIDNIHPNTLKIMPGDFYRFEQDKFIFNPY